MATKQLKLKGKTIVWGANLNVRINSVYTKDGKSYQNITGRNSDPETPGNPDWFKIDDVTVDLSNKLDKPENTYDPSEDPGEIYVVLVDGDDVSYRIPLSEVGGISDAVHSFVYDGENATQVLAYPIKKIIDVQVDNGCNFDNILNEFEPGDTEVTFDSTELLSGQKIKLIYK